VVTVPPLRVLPLSNEPGLAEAVDAEADGRNWEADTPCDRAALTALYSELAPAVHRFLRDLLGDDALAADALQEAFVRAFRRIDTVPRGTRLAAWVFGIARNVSLELRRARGRTRRVLVDEGARLACRVAVVRARSPEAQLLDREAVVVVTRALAQLPEDRRAALLLRLDHGLAYDEIARAMGWSLSKVKVEIFRAREVLRATFDAYRGGMP
jgi:RNA polymerase sigma-70 factor (ECF subfamily)